jgi:hypothetical protein
MDTLAFREPRGKLTRPDKQAAIEAKLREIHDATTNLLGDIDTAWSGVSDMMRAEASRLNEIGFVLTRCLCNGDVETAYGMVIGNDVDGEVWGVAI